MTQTEKDKAAAEARLEWLSSRQRGIGGSDVAAIMGVSPYRTALDVYYDKVTPIVEDRQTSEAAYWGTQLEEVVAQEFSRRTGMKVQRVTETISSQLTAYVGDQAPADWARGNIDRAVINPELAGVVKLTKNPRFVEQGLKLTTDTILECKTASTYKSSEWGASQEAEIKEGEVTSEHEIPVYYETQVQWYMGVTGAKRCFVAVLIGGQDFRIYLVERNEPVIQALATACFEFFEKHVRARIPPEPTSVEGVKRLFPQDSGEMSEASNDEAALIGEYRNLKGQIAELEAQQKAVASKLICAIGERAGLTIGGEKAATYKTQTANRFSSTALKAARPEIFAEYVKTASTRVLRVA